MKQPSGVFSACQRHGLFFFICERYFEDFKDLKLLGIKVAVQI